MWKEAVWSGLRYRQRLCWRELEKPRQPSVKKTDLSARAEKRGLTNTKQEWGEGLLTREGTKWRHIYSDIFYSWHTVEAIRRTDVTINISFNIVTISGVYRRGIVVPEMVNACSQPYRTAVDTSYSVQRKERFPANRRKTQHLKSDEV
jgi:hypothetical protein